MGGRGGGSPGNRGGQSSDSSSATGASIVRAAYEAAVTAPGPWVRLPAIRDEMAARGLTRRDQQDAAIMDFAMQKDARVIPVANLKSLSQADRNAAIKLGGELKHAIMVER